MNNNELISKFEINNESPTKTIRQNKHAQYNFDNKDPEEGIEYFYDLNMRWNAIDLESIPTEVGIIVNNVKKRDSGYSYQFTIKGQSEIYYCNYAWAFVKNTEENIKKYKELQDMIEVITKLEKLKIAKSIEVETLYNREEVYKDHQRSLTPEENQTLKDFFWSHFK